MTCSTCSDGEVRLGPEDVEERDVAVEVRETPDLGGGLRVETCSGCGRFLRSARIDGPIGQTSLGGFDP